jgi:hypothetical protein
MLAGVLAGHAVGYRLAFSDPHARADALSHSGHSYFAYLPFALTVCVAVLLAGLALEAISAFRGEPRRPTISPVVVLLAPAAFVTQEVTERLLHTGQIPWTIVLQPAFLIGLALQLPIALAALLLAWALDSAARAVGDALAATPRPMLHVQIPVPVRGAAIPRVAGLARGYGERAPPVLRRP